MWNKDEIKGKGKQIFGAIKHKAGELIKDRKLEVKGEAERIAGKVRRKPARRAGKPLKLIVTTAKAIAGRAYPPSLSLTS